MKRATVLGIDLAKNIFQVHGIDEHGKVIIRRSFGRGGLIKFIANLKPCLIGIEACGGSHHWAREFRKYGHSVRMMAPQYVKPYVKTNKNDFNDAEAICEAVQRPSMRFVAEKTVK
jgi:transposase